MPQNDAARTFDRDFGYLMPFLDKVQAAGEALPPGAREEIAALLSGERERWMRIRELLAGAGASAAAPPSRPRVGAPAPSVAAPAGSRFAFTVGTLRRRDS